MTCLCHQHGAPRCKEGERLYQLDREAYENVLDKGAVHATHHTDYTLHELHAAQDAYTAARKAWLNHRTGDAGERFMERVREFTEKHET